MKLFNNIRTEDVTSLQGGYSERKKKEGQLPPRGRQWQLLRAYGHGKKNIHTQTMENTLFVNGWTRRAKKKKKKTHTHTHAKKLQKVPQYGNPLKR